MGFYCSPFLPSVQIPQELAAVPALPEPQNSLCTQDLSISLRWLGGLGRALVMLCSLLDLDAHSQESKINLRIGGKKGEEINA